MNDNVYHIKRGPIADLLFAINKAALGASDLLFRVSAAVARAAMRAEDKAGDRAVKLATIKVEAIADTVVFLEAQLEAAKARRVEAEVLAAKVAQARASFLFK